MVRGYASTTDYTVNWSMNAIENREIDVQDLSERRIKVLLLVYFYTIMIIFSVLQKYISIC